MYEDQILSIWSFLFILLPIELSFIPLPKDNDHIHNTIDTLLLSCYILKSIEVLIFEPILLIIISLKLNNDDVEILWRQTIYVLIIIDIVKYAILNIYLFVYGAFAVQIKNKVQVWTFSRKCLIFLICEIFIIIMIKSKYKTISSDERSYILKQFIDRGLTAT